MRWKTTFRREARDAHGKAVLRCSAFLVLTSMWAVTAHAQNDSSRQHPRTPWGHPDLQGVWSNETITPFERPLELGDREFLTPAEIEAAERGVAARLASDSAAGEPITEPPPKGGNVGAYNLAWMDFGTKVVSTHRTSLVVAPKNGRVPVRAEMLELRDRELEQSYDDYELMSPWDRCITRGIPGGMFPAGYNNYYRIVQTPRYVVILYEMIHDARIIPLYDRETIGSDAQLWNGESRGRWEGETLVVETSNYSERGWFATSASQRRVKGVRQSPRSRTVERFERIDDQTIDWSVHVEDASRFEDSWTVNIPLVARPQTLIYEYACHEGNQAVRNILSGARAVGNIDG